MDKRKSLGIAFIFNSVFLILADRLSFNLTGAVVGSDIKVSFVTMLALVFFFVGLLFISKIGKGLAALVLGGAAIYGGSKIFSPKQDYWEVINNHIKNVEITSPYYSEKGKFQRTYRYDPIFDIKEGIYDIPQGTLGGLAGRESGGDPLKLNSTGDGGAGMFMFQPGTAAEMGLKVYGYSRKVGVDKKHGAELKKLIKEHKLNYDTLAKIDERFDVEKSADAAARYLVKLHNKYGSWDKALSAYNQGKPAPNPETTKHVKGVRRYQEVYTSQDTTDYYKMYKKGRIKGISGLKKK